MNKPNPKGVVGNLSPLESAQTDSHLLRFCGLPSEDSHRMITFQVILGDLVRYLDTGGWQGGPLSTFSINAIPKINGFLDVINTFAEIVGFPEECWGSVQLAVNEKDACGLAVACREAIDYLHRVRVEPDMLLSEEEESTTLV